MKKLGIVLVLSIALMLLLVPAASAIELSTYNSGFQVQNLSGTDAATIVITFYNQDGTVNATVPDTIDANSSTTYFPIGATAGFNGSVVISSDQPVAAIVNVIGGTNEGSSYSSFDSGSDTVSLPLVNKDNFDIDTWFNVQNVGSTATTVTVAYSNQPSCDENAVIEPGAAATFDQFANTCLPAGYVGAATITTDEASDAIVASVLQVAPAGLFAYNGFNSGSTEPVMPLISANVFGFHTGMQIQNQGATDTEVTVSYSPTPGGTNGTACTETRTVPAGGSETFTLYAFSLTGTTTSTCTFGEYFVGSASVTGNSTSQPLVAIVNQTDFAQKGSAYNGFDPSSATDTLVMPLIMDGFNIWTGYNIQNVGGDGVTVTCDYSDADATYNDTATLDAGEAMNVVQLGAVAGGQLPPNLGAAYVGSATCTATAGGLLLGVVNQANTTTGATDDTTLTYEAFNQ